jgi:hypothetical protein
MPGLLGTKQNAPKFNLVSDLNLHREEKISCCKALGPIWHGSKQLQLLAIVRGGAKADEAENSGFAGS